MIQGVFQENIPLIRVAIGWGQFVQTPFVVLDTGFTGDLQVTPRIASDLGLQVVGVTKSRIANGNIMEVPTALAIAAMEDMTQTINVLIVESVPLVGISFLTKFGYRAIVDCKHRSIVLEKA